MTPVAGRDTSRAISPKRRPVVELKPSSSSSLFVPSVSHDPYAGRALMWTRALSNTCCQTRTSTVTVDAWSRNGTSRAISPKRYRPSALKPSSRGRGMFPSVRHEPTAARALT